MSEQEGLGSVASSRSTRKASDRPKVWSPPNKLETPPPPEGKHYRWVRFNAGGEGDDSNVYERVRQGYRPVMKEELEDYHGDHIREGRGEHIPEGVVRQGDLMLMEVDVAITKQRTKHYSDQAKRMQQAVDQELDGHATPNMPILRESSSSVTQGRPQEITIDDS